MSSLGASIRSQLIGDTGVAAIVSSRIYPKCAPASATLPFIIYRRVSGGPLNTMGGPIATQNVHVETVCVAESEAEVISLTDAVRSALNGWTDTTGTPSVTSCMLTDEDEDYEPPTDGSDSGIHIRTHDYSVWFS